MAKMIIKAMKLTDDIESIKVAYEKNGQLFVRNGNDGFRSGTKAQANLDSLGKWGFRLVEPNPQFHDAEELIDSLDKFHLDGSGTIKYQG